MVVLAVGCACPDVNCNPGSGPEPRLLQARLIERAGDRFTFESDEGVREEIDVEGRTWAIDDGERYLVPVYTSGDGTARASVSDGCDECEGRKIAHLDGTAIDVGRLSWLGHRASSATAMSAMAFGVVVMLWGLGRVVARRAGWMD